MARWEDKMRRVNARLVARFSHDVILHLSSGDKTVLGVFDNPSVLRESNDARISDTDTTVYLKDEDVVCVSARSLLTVDSRKWSVIYPPEPDGTGLTKLTLSKYDGKQQSVSDLRY